MDKFFPSVDEAIDYLLKHKESLESCGLRIFFERGLQAEQKSFKEKPYLEILEEEKENQDFGWLLPRFYFI